MQTVLLTGSDGFIGQHVAPALVSAGFSVRYSTLRAERFSTVQSMKELQGVDVVINLVGLAHSNPKRVQEHDYFQVNAEFPQRLAECALKAGVKRFVHISSVKAVEYNASLVPNDESNQAQAHDVYGASKFAGEQNLFRLNWQPSQCVVLRPSLVYGAGVKANMRSLLIASRSRLCPELLDSGRRSMLSVANLCSALITVLGAEQLQHRLYIITDSVDFTVADIQNATRHALMRDRPFLRVSASTLSKLLQWLSLFPNGWFDRVFNALDKLSESELYSANRFESEFNWTARHSLEDVMPDMLSAL